MRTAIAGGCLTLCLLTSAAPPQSSPTPQGAQDRDALFRRYGYVSGQAYQCRLPSDPDDPDEHAELLERTTLAIGMNVFGLYGLDRAAAYAKAFAAGTSDDFDRHTCPAIINEMDVMTRRLKVLAGDEGDQATSR